MHCVLYRNMLLLSKQLRGNEILIRFRVLSINTRFAGEIFISTIKNIEPKQRFVSLAKYCEQLFEYFVYVFKYFCAYFLIFLNIEQI